MKREEIENQINLMNRIEFCRKALPTLKMNWETDLEKINLEKMAGGEWLNKNFTPQKIEKLKTENQPFDNDQLLNKELGDRMIRLIEFVMTGEKLIPPLFHIDYQVINGEKTILEPLQRIDGGHRIRLAKYLGINEIPILTAERIKRYVFTLPFDIEYMDNGLKIRQNGNEYFFEYNNWYLDERNADTLVFEKINI